MFLLRQSTHRMVIQYHPHIGHVYVPNLNARIFHESGGYYARTNSTGFRSDIEFVKQRTDRPRILFFGDSVTAGDGCDNGQRFTELIGEALDAEVYNYGLSGSGTDQQLLIYEQFARDVEADLIVVCVSVENIERIQVPYRETIERATGQRVLVPKPYFTLEDNGLVLQQVPVPRTRPRSESVEKQRYYGLIPYHWRWHVKLRSLYRHSPHLAPVRAWVHRHFPDLRSQLLRTTHFQPHAAYKDPTSCGWRLMSAILERFFAQASPVPILVVPLPTFFYYYDGARPIYQELYQALADPARKRYVADSTTPLLQLSRTARRQLCFRRDKTHFSPYGHGQVARLITDEIRRHHLLPRRKAVRTNVKPRPAQVGEKPTYILGLSCFYHDSAACLVKDGEIVSAAEEERFTRIKNDRRFPHYASNYCLEEGGIHQTDLSAVVYYDNAPLTFERLMQTLLAVHTKAEEAWQRTLPSWVRYKLHLPRLIRQYLQYDGLILHEVHHRSHAASAFYPSPFARAAILTIDGVGEWATASICVGNGSDIQVLKQMEFPHSLGLLYSAFTQFTGFKVNSGEYKLMGLAPYGEPKYVDTILEHLADLKADGSLELHLDYFAYLSEATMTNDRFANLFGGPARHPEARITQREMDLARSIQAITEEAMLRMARYAYELTGEKFLCLAGGVALNCVGNGRLLREGPFADLWIQPAAGDAGCALGAALDAYHTYFKQPRPIPQEGRSPQRGSCLGPAFSDAEIRAFLDTHDYPYHHLALTNRAQTLADLIAAGNVVGHFCGRMEFGPRALGSRSILGDARNEDMQVKLNVKIKYRESFRPFAPTVLAERVGEYFALDRESPYMLLVAPVKEDRRKPFNRGCDEDLLPVVRQPRSDIPAVTHVDYSARIQTVCRADHPPYYDLLQAFETKTGCAVIVNTSFNVRGEPIICTPYDAYRCFMRTEMDVLIMGNCLLFKEEQPDWPEPKGHVEEHSSHQTAPLQGPFAEELRQIFTHDFLPAAAAVHANSRLRFCIISQTVPTTWVDYPAKQTAEAIFSIPPELDQQSPDPEQMVDAILRFWAPNATTETVRPLLVKLLQLGLRYPPVREALEEEVSESMYVMF